MMNILRLFIPFATLWVFNPIYAKVVELQEVTLPEEVDVYGGVIRNGGLYRLFHIKDEEIVAIVYESKTFKLNKDMNRAHYDLYVEEYIRDDQIYLEIFPMLKTRIFVPVLRPRIYWLNGTRPIRVTRHDLNEFLDGPIYLRLDVGQEAKNHPFIRKYSIESEPPFDTVYELLEAKPESVIRGASRYKGPYRISDIHNSDLLSGSTVNDTPSVICGAFRVRTNKSAGTFLLDIKHMQGLVQYIVDLSTAHIVASQDSTQDVRTYWMLHRMPKDSDITGDLSLIVDITTFHYRSTYLLSLVNVPAGNWLFSRHQVALSHAVRILRVTIVDDDTVIYESPRDVFVTHIETFAHTTDARLFILVNETVWENGEFVQQVKGYQSGLGGDLTYTEVDVSHAYDAIAAELPDPFEHDTKPDT